MPVEMNLGYCCLFFDQFVDIRLEFEFVEGEEVYVLS